jgi:hypothetical protein
MRNPQDQHGPGSVINLDEHPIVAATRAAEIRELAGQRHAEPHRVRGEHGGEELDNGNSDLGRQPTQLATRG